MHVRSVPIAGDVHRRNDGVHRFVAVDASVVRLLILAFSTKLPLGVAPDYVPSDVVRPATAMPALEADLLRHT